MNKTKNKILNILAVVFAAAFFLAAGSSTSYAAKGDYGTDQSMYQGAYGKAGYGNEKFQINQIGGYYNGKFVPHWTYQTQTSSDLQRGIHAHTYIYAQFSGRWQADQMLNYYLPRIATPKGSIVALDVESGWPDADSVLYALNRIKAAGYTPVLYGYKNFLINHLGYNGLLNISNQYPLWLAEYPDYSVRRYPNYGFFPSFNNVAIFQFTSTYVWGGLDGDVDLTGITDNGYTKSTQPVQKPAPKPAQPVQRPAQQNVRSTTWRDGLGDVWHSERGTFTAGTWINLRWGARTTSARIATLAPGSTVKYDAWSVHGGYVWIRQPRSQGGYAYLAVRNSYNHQPFGYFK